MVRPSAIQQHRAMLVLLLLGVGCGGRSASDPELSSETPLASGFALPVRSEVDLADPGILKVNQRFIAATTGRLGWVSYSDDGAAGPWKTAHHLLTAAPAWASSNIEGLWAPSVIQVGGSYVAFFAAVRRSTGSYDYESAHTRCIGTATSRNPEGPFVPRLTPLVCPGLDNAAPDKVPGRPIYDWKVGVIDATPRYLDFNGEHGLYLTRIGFDRAYRDRYFGGKPRVDEKRHPV